MRRKFRVTSGGLGRHDAHVGDAALLSMFRGQTEPADTHRMSVPCAMPLLSKYRTLRSIVRDWCSRLLPRFPIIWMNSDAGITLRRYVDHRAARDKPRREWGRRFAGICTGA